MAEDNKKQLQLELSPETAKGSYSNLAIITHSKSEFVIDFAAVLPGLPKVPVNNRIIMNPEHAKRLLNALQDNIVKYENQHGFIDILGQQKGGGTFNFEDFGNFGNGNPKN